MELKDFEIQKMIDKDGTEHVTMVLKENAQEETSEEGKIKRR